MILEIVDFVLIIESKIVPIYMLSTKFINLVVTYIFEVSPVLEYKNCRIQLKYTRFHITKTDHIKSTHLNMRIWKDRLNQLGLLHLDPPFHVSNLHYCNYCFSKSKVPKA
jgi:hypothetical protein